MVGGRTPAISDGHQQCRKNEPAIHGASRQMADLDALFWTHQRAGLSYAGKKTLEFRCSPVCFCSSPCCFPPPPLTQLLAAAGSGQRAARCAADQPRQDRHRVCTRTRRRKRWRISCPTSATATYNGTVFHRVHCRSADPGRCVHHRHAAQARSRTGRQRGPRNGLSNLRGTIARGTRATEKDSANRTVLSSTPSTIANSITAPTRTPTAPATACSAGSFEGMDVVDKIRVAPTAAKAPSPPKSPLPPC